MSSKKTAKKRVEMGECTFKPQLNPKSARMAKDHEFDWLYMRGETPKRDDLENIEEFSLGKRNNGSKNKTGITSKNAASPTT